MKVLIADDHALLRDGLVALLRARPDLQIVATVGSGREAVRLAHELRPELVIMDISMRDLNGVDATRMITTELRGTRVLALSMHSDRRYVIAMFKAGAAGYVIKDSAASELLHAVDAVARGRNYVSAEIADAVVGILSSGTPEAPAERLTSREREVLQLIAEGLTSKEIAMRLAISVPTVETHRRAIMKKLNLHSVAELTKFSVREGLTTLDD